MELFWWGVLAGTAGTYCLSVLTLVVIIAREGKAGWGRE